MGRYRSLWDSFLHIHLVKITQKTFEITERSKNGITFVKNSRSIQGDLWCSALFRQTLAKTCQEKCESIFSTVKSAMFCSPFKVKMPSISFLPWLLVLCLFQWLLKEMRMLIGYIIIQPSENASDWSLAKRIKILHFESQLQCIDETVLMPDPLFVMSGLKELLNNE